MLNETRSRSAKMACWYMDVWQVHRLMRMERKLRQGNCTADACIVTALIRSGMDMHYTDC